MIYTIEYDWVYVLVISNQVHGNDVMGFRVLGDHVCRPHAVMGSEVGHLKGSSRNLYVTVLGTLHVEEKTTFTLYMSMLEPYPCEQNGVQTCRGLQGRGISGILLWSFWKHS